MSPDDPRHGTEAGCREHYRDGETPCAPCLEDHRRRNIMRQLYPHKRPALGSQRRIQALQAIGHGRDKIAAELGYSNGGALTYLMRADSLLTTTAERIADVYDRLCMTVPMGAGPSRARTWAARNGFSSPLAWDDIDDPDEQPYSGTNPRHGDDIDPVAVARTLSGDIPHYTTVAEKRETVRLWLEQGRTLAALERHTGWKVERYTEREAVA